MNDCRFDNWTRAFVSKIDRRSATMQFAGAAAAVVALAQAELGFAQDSAVDLERNCTVNGNRCRRDNQCCSFRCRKRRRQSRGKCQCAGAGARCQRDNGCCSGVCRSGKCDCGDRGDFCNNDSDCCSRRCESGSCRCGRRGDRCNNNRGCCSESCSGGFCD